MEENFSGKEEFDGFSVCFLFLYLYLTKKNAETVWLSPLQVLSHYLIHALALTTAAIQRLIPLISLILCLVSELLKEPTERNFVLKVGVVSVERLH